jgi:hypothetical protein
MKKKAVGSEQFEQNLLKFALDTMKGIRGEDWLQGFIEETNEAHSALVDEAFVRTLRASELVD